MKNRIVAVLCLIVMAFAFGSCSKQSEATDALSGALPLPTQRTKATAAEPVRGGSLNVAIPSGLTSFNPLDVDSVEWLSFLSLIYESPLTLDSTGKISPCLAESWSFDEDLMTWTFKIRKGVVWHGTEKTLTADDIAYTLDCLREDPNLTDSIYGEVLKSIESYSAPTEEVLEVTVKDPGALFLYSMVFPVISMDAGTDSSMPVGTGPYKAVSCKLTEKIELEANEKWWKEQPFIQKITGLVYENNAAILEAYNAKEIDIAYTADLSASQFQLEGVTETKEIITKFYSCLIPNLRRQLPASVNIRKAISYALDRSEISSRVFLGHAVAADMPVISGEYMYNVRNESYEYNKNKAIAALEAEGYFDRDKDCLVENVAMKRIELKILIRSQAQHQFNRETAIIIQNQLKDIGIKLNIEEMAEDDYSSALEGGNFDLALADFYLSRIPDWSSLIVYGGDCNYGDYSNQEMKAFFDAYSSADEKNILNASAAMQKFFLTDLPHIGLYFKTKTLVYAAGLQQVTGVTDPNLFDTLPKWFWSK